MQQEVWDGWKMQSACKRKKKNSPYNLAWNTSEAKDQLRDLEDTDK
jgi:hypothetical protein